MPKRTRALAVCLKRTPCGVLCLVASTRGLVMSCFEENREFAIKKIGLEFTQRSNGQKRNRTQSSKSLLKAEKHLQLASQAFEEYFSCNLRAFLGLKIDLSGTVFQKKVYRVLRRIRPGHTVTYSELAKKIKHPGASRAVGSACKSNPLLIVVPCHRVVSVSDYLSGYSGGIERKEFLLRHEGAVLL